jgi:glycine cleavage system H protein
MQVKEGLLYTKEHEWIKVEGTSATVGISDYAQHKLGDITYVEPPAEGKQVKAGDVLTGIESVKAASDIFAPLDGKVTQANAALEAAPELVNKSPYEEGWIAKIELTGAAATAALMDAAAYGEYIKGLE